MAGMDLAYIALATRDPGQLSKLLGEDLELPAHNVSTPDGATRSAFAIGQSALVVIEAGDTFLSTPHNGVDHIAMVAEKPAAKVSELGLPPKACDGLGLNSHDQACVEKAAVSGIELRFTQSLGLSAPSGTHIQRIDHIGIASSDNATAEKVYVDQIGCIYESRQTDMEVSQAIESFTSDKYGAIYHSRPPVPVGGLKVSFITVGDCELEFLQNFDPAQGFEIKHGTPGDTKQDQSAIGRYVEKRGAGLHHIALKCHDIDALLPYLADT
ncbi:MAG: VOC family protein [Pseudomonadota bacterium]